MQPLARYVLQAHGLRNPFDIQYDRWAPAVLTHLVYQIRPANQRPHLAIGLGQYLKRFV